MAKKTILLVEDDFLNRRLSKKILLENGYRVLESKNANEAIDLLKKESVDLLILDINLGENETDGIGLGQFIKEKYSLPFIYLTAYENSEIINRAVATLPFCYLTKPFKNVDLVASVEIAIRQSALAAKYKPSLVVKDGDFNVELPLEDINFIESEGNYLLFYTDKKTYKSRSTIKQVLEVLPESNFAQVHRAYVVNKTKIEKYTNKELVINNILIPVSKTYTDQIGL